VAARRDCSAVRRCPDDTEEVIQSSFSKELLCDSF
jgi:hypothetical protein